MFKKIKQWFSRTRPTTNSLEVVEVPHREVLSKTYWPEPVEDSTNPKLVKKPHSTIPRHIKVKGAKKGKKR